MKKKPVTLESIAKKLNTVDKRFDHIDKHLGIIDTRFVSVETGLGGRIDSLTLTVAELAEATYNGFDRVESRFEKIETILATKADKDDIVRLGRRIDHLDVHINQVEKRLDERIDALDIHLGTKIDDLRDEVNGFTSDVHDELSARITVLEKKRA